MLFFPKGLIKGTDFLVRHCEEEEFSVLLGKVSL